MIAAFEFSLVKLFKGQNGRFDPHPDRMGIQIIYKSELWGSMAAFVVRFADFVVLSWVFGIFVYKSQHRRH